MSLFFADDGLLLSQNKEKAIKNIKMLTEIAGECGLQINKDKSTVLIYNSKDQSEEIEGLKITKEIKYLGVSIINQKNCFKNQIEKSIKKGKIYANNIPSIIAKASNKILIGKTFWK